MGEKFIRLTLSQTTTRSLGIGRNRLPQGQGVSRSIWSKLHRWHSGSFMY